MKQEVKVVGPVEAVFDRRTKQCKCVIIEISEESGEVATTFERTVLLLAELKHLLLEGKLGERPLSGSSPFNFDTSHLPTVSMDPHQEGRIRISGTLMHFILERCRIETIIDSLESLLGYSGHDFRDLLDKAMKWAAARPPMTPVISTPDSFPSPIAFKGVIQ